MLWSCYGDDRGAVSGRIGSLSGVKYRAPHGPNILHPDLKPRCKKNLRGHAASLWLSLVPQVHFHLSPIVFFKTVSLSHIDLMTYHPLSVQLETAGNYDSRVAHGMLWGPTEGKVPFLWPFYMIEQYFICWNDCITIIVFTGKKHNAATRSSTDLSWRGS